MKILPLTAFAALGLLVLGSCITRTTTKPDFGKGEARQAEPAGAWKVVSGTKLAGYAIRFEERSGAKGSLISVRNAHNQDMGWVDTDGRAWRYRLHGDPEWVGTGTVLQATRFILGLDRGVALEELELSEMPPGQ